MPIKPPLARVTTSEKSALTRLRGMAGLVLANQIRPTRSLTR